MVNLTGKTALRVDSLKFMNASITAIIPTYDRRSLLPRALDSVLAQSVPPSEIIVVDDGSSDGTADFVREQYPSVNLIEQENQGVSASRNRGIEAARGDWLAFLDSDDEWLPRKLELQLTALSRNLDYRICYGEEIWMRKGNRVNPPRKYIKSGGHIFKACLSVCLIAPSATIIHREIFAAVGLFDITLPAAEDYDLWLRICARYPVLCLPDPLIIKFDGHSDQLSHQWGIDRYRIRALEKILDSSFLIPEYYTAALSTLKRKCEIFSNGARKRGKMEEASVYSSIPERFLDRTAETHRD